MPTHPHKQPHGQPQKPPRESPLVALATIVLFFAAIWTPLLVGWVQENATLSKTENRYLATWPAAPGDLAAASAYPGELQSYFSDHLGLRDRLLRLNSWVRISVLGVSPSDRVIVGKHGWLFFDEPAVVAQYRGLARFSDEELARWTEVLLGRRDWLRERGIEFVLVLVPNKHMIYPEFMPDTLPRVATEEQHQQLARHLQRTTDLVVVDLMPLMRRSKEQRRVYHLTDTHWNDVGAYQAYRAILAAVGRVLPDYAGGLAPTKVQLRTYMGDGIGLARITGLPDVYREEILALDKLEARSQIKSEHRADYKQREREQRPLAHGTGDPQMPRAVMFRDSFANALIPYLSENFNRILYVWSKDVVPRIVEREQPEVVIQQIAGRFLDLPPNAIEHSDSKR